MNEIHNAFKRERIRINYTQGDLSEALNVTQSLISKIETGNSTPTIDILKKMVELGADFSDILTGEGSMLKSDKIDSNAEIVHFNNIPEPKPHIDDSYADCGIPHGFSVAIKASDCELVSIPFISSNYDFSIRARGDSMINRTNPNRSIKDKDIIICKLWKSRTHIRWGEVYALATVDGVVIKKVLPVDGDMTKIRCESFNKEDNFPDYTLSIEEILDWATVEGVFSINKW